MQAGESNQVIIDNTTRNLTVSSSTSDRTSSSTTTSGDSNFESQLSAALAESLQKLGMNTGEVNISIRNPTSSTRQILVTYSIDDAVDTSKSAAAETSIPTTPPSTSQGNPFSGYIEHSAPAPVVVADPTEWAPYTGPKDARDQVPAGGGKTTASGSPLIVNNKTDAANQYGYVGPATKSPYFTTPSNPLREGYVLGFRKWFSDPLVVGGLGAPIPANKANYSTEEGAQEALRIVQQFAPDAKVVQSVWQSGPFSVDKPLYEIDLGDGRRLNAGGVLCGYYNQGYGVTISSDETIRRAMQLA